MNKKMESHENRHRNVLAENSDRVQEQPGRLGTTDKISASPFRKTRTSFPYFARVDFASHP